MTSHSYESVAGRTDSSRQATTVQVFDGLALIGTAEVGADGRWTTTTLTFAVGVHTVTAQAVGASQPSRPWTFTVVRPDFEGLAEPSFPHADRWGYLNCCSVPRIWEGVTVRVAGDSNFAAGDRVDLTWQGCASLNGTNPIPGVNRTFSTTLDASQASNGFDVVVPYADLVEPLLDNASGTAQYLLYKVDGKIGRSKMNFIKVTRLMPSGEICSPTNDLCTQEQSIR